MQYIQMYTSCPSRIHMQWSDCVLCLVLFLQLVDYAKKGDTDEKAMKMATFWLTVRVCSSLSLSLWSWHSECKTVIVKLLFSLSVLLLFRKKIWCQSSSRSSLRGLRICQKATRGWHAFPTDWTWTERRWPSWSTKATPSRLSILWKKRMHWHCSTSCSKATERSGDESYPRKPNYQPPGLHTVAYRHGSISSARNSSKAPVSTKAKNISVSGHLWPVMY